jgi:hypothetical protein
LRPLPTNVPADHTPSDIPVYEDQQARDEHYRNAETEGQPYIAVERYEEGYTVTYDLLPAGAELSAPMAKELNERVVRAVESVVGDDGRATTEVSQSLSASLGNVGVFETERAAREVAVVIARVALDEDNWVEAAEIGGPGGDALRRN